jgi:hypothetical protein
VALELLIVRPDPPRRWRIVVEIMDTPTAECPTALTEAEVRGIVSLDTPACAEADVVSVEVVR